MRRHAKYLLVVALALGALGTSLLPARAAASTARDRPPNIVLILADDAGVETIGAYGGERPTPRIDALAAEGVRFENAHATPLCTPSRVRLLTGRYSFRNYRAFGFLDPREPTLAKVLKGAGYRTAVAGKWQLGGNPLDGVPGATPGGAGFDESIVWAGGRNFIEDGCQYWGATLTTNGRRETYPRQFGPDVVHRWARDFIERSRARPFFLYYSMILPHDPWVATPDRLDADTPERKFTAMLGYMDTQVGDLLDLLDRLGLAERTIVVFVADNGTHPTIVSRRHGVPVAGGKGTTLATGTHVPLVVRWPSRIAGARVSEQPVDLTDLYATLATAGGDRKAAQASDGFDLVPSLTTDAAPARRAIFMDYAADWWPLRPVRYAFTPRWKLYGDGRLFDVAADPLEGTPVPADHAAPEAIAARSELAALLDAMGDRAMAIDDPHFPPGFDPTTIDYAAVRADLQARVKACGDPARAPAVPAPRAP
jgi:arylsulfatase A-like enzyme